MLFVGTSMTLLQVCRVPSHGSCLLLPCMFHDPCCYCFYFTLHVCRYKICLIGNIGKRYMPWSLLNPRKGGVKCYAHHWIYWNYYFCHVNMHALLESMLNALQLYINTRTDVLPGTPYHSLTLLFIALLLVFLLIRRTDFLGQ